MRSLEGRSALVTGAGRGIGAATARKLTAAGARVLVNDLDADVAEETAAGLDGAIAYPADLSDSDAGDQLVAAAIEEFGGLDIVVNNAGYIWHSAIHNMTDEQWDAMIDIHAGGPTDGGFVMSRAASRTSARSSTSPRSVPCMANRRRWPTQQPKPHCWA